MSFWCYIGDYTNNNLWWKLPIEKNDTNINFIEGNPLCKRCNTFIKTGKHFNNNIFCLDCYEVRIIRPTILKFLMKREITF